MISSRRSCARPGSRSSSTATTTTVSRPPTRSPPCAPARRTLSVTVGGLGERAGNACLAEVAAALESLHGAHDRPRPRRVCRALADAGRGALPAAPFPKARRSSAATCSPTNPAFTSPACWPIPRPIAAPIRSCSAAAIASSSASTLARRRWRTRSRSAASIWRPQVAARLIPLVRREATRVEARLSIDEVVRLHEEASDRAPASPQSPAATLVRRVDMSCSLDDRPTDRTDIVQRLKSLSSAEDFFATLGVPYDEAVLRVARLHILKRMGEYLAVENLESLPDAVAAARARAMLERAYADFASSSPLAAARLQGAQGARSGTAGPAEDGVRRRSTTSPRCRRGDRRYERRNPSATAGARPLVARARRGRTRRPRLLRPTEPRVAFPTASRRKRRTDDAGREEVRGNQGDRSRWHDLCVSRPRSRRGGAHAFRGLHQAGSGLGADPRPSGHQHHHAPGRADDHQPLRSVRARDRAAAARRSTAAR